MLAFSGFGANPATSNMFQPAPGLPQNYLPPPNFSCTPGLCIQQLQTLLNTLVVANIQPGYTFPTIKVDGNVGPDTVNSILFLASTGVPQFALVDANISIPWVAANTPSLVQSYATYLGIDPATLVAPPLAQKPPPPWLPPAPPPAPDGGSPGMTVTPTDQPPPADQPPAQPDGSEPSPGMTLTPTDQPPPLLALPGVAPFAISWVSVGLGIVGALAGIWIGGRYNKPVIGGAVGGLAAYFAGQYAANNISFSVGG